MVIAGGLVLQLLLEPVLWAAAAVSGSQPVTEQKIRSGRTAESCDGVQIHASKTEGCLLGCCCLCWGLLWYMGTSCQQSTIA